MARSYESHTYPHLIYRLRIVARALFAVRLAVTVLGVLFLALSLLFSAGVAETLGYFSPQMKQPLLLVIVLLPSLALIGGAMYHLLRRPGVEDAARLLERAYPGIQNRLISAVQLGELSGNELRGQSPELIGALIDQAAHEAESLTIKRALPTGRLVRTYRLAASMLVLVLFAVILLPGYAGGILRLVDARHAYEHPGSVSIFTVSQPGRIIRGENFSVNGFVAGEDGAGLRILYRWAHEERWQVKPVTVDANGAFTATVEKPHEPFRYYLEAADAATPVYDVTVIERPGIESFTVSLTYPPYTGLGTVTRTDSDGIIRAITGTSVTITAEANKPITEMAMVMDSVVIPCDIAGQSGTVSFDITESADYHFALTDSLGISNIDPVVYRITALSDEFPRVTLLHPATDVVLPNSMTLPVVYRVQDDFGLSAVEVSYRLAYEETARSLQLPFEDATAYTGEYRWNLSGLNLLPDDTVTFSVVVHDTDTVNGPKRTESESRLIRVPSVTDIYTETMESQQRDIDRLREITGRAADQEERLDEVNRSLKTGADLEWSEQQDMDQARKDMAAMQRDVQEVADHLEQAADRLSDEEVVAVETLAKMTEISALMNEIADGDMKDALRQLTQATVETDPKTVKQLLDAYQATTEDIQKKLDRIIALLEQAKTLQQLEIAKNLLEDMAIRQAILAAKYELTPEDVAHASQERALATEMENIQKTLDAAVDSVASQFGVETGDVKAALETSDTATTMEQASTSMEQKREAEAGEQLDQANRSIADLLDAMDALGSRLENANTEEIKRRLFAALNQLVVLSGKQETLLGRIGSEDTEVLAREQLAIIEGLGRADVSLAKVGELMADLARVAEQVTSSSRLLMESTVAALSAGNGDAGGKHAADTLKMLNRSIHFLASLLEQSGGGSSGQGMPGDLMQQLQQIASGQLDLQQQLSADQMGQLAAEQQKLGEMLSELGQKIFQDNQLKAMLDKLAEEMDDTAELMRQDQPRELVERRQLDIYRRLLDARRSRREKDETEERKSWTARENVSEGADRLAGDLGERGQIINQRLREALEDDIDPAYKAMIRRYFESLLAQPEVRN